MTLSTLLGRAIGLLPRRWQFRAMLVVSRFHPVTVFSKGADANADSGAIQGPFALTLFPSIDQSKIVSDPAPTPLRDLRYPWRS